jgi:hypothetical protein
MNNGQKIFLRIVISIALAFVVWLIVNAFIMSITIGEFAIIEILSTITVPLGEWFKDKFNLNIKKDEL